MGFLTNLFQTNKNGAVFDDQYNRLKELAAFIMPYEYANFDKAMMADKVLPACNEFIIIAQSINEFKAIRKLREEAKKYDNRTKYPYHPAFKTVVFGDANDWNKVVHEVEKIKSKFGKWIDGLNTYNVRLNNLTSSPIQLTDGDLSRNKINTMPEVKYASVGKAFNKDKLTSFVVIDTETTGLNASRGRIVQLSAIKYIEWEPVEKWDSYINPGKVEIEEEAMKINGLSNDMLVGKPIINEIANSFIEFIGDSAVVGYNLPFDIKFLYAEGIDLISGKRKLYDVLQLARKYYKKELESFSLVDVASYNKIFFNAHNSLQDCLATGDIFVKIINGLTN